MLAARDTLRWAFAFQSSGSKIGQIDRCPHHTRGRVEIARTGPVLLVLLVALVGDDQMFEPILRLRELGIHGFKGVGHRLRDRDVSEPLVIGRDDMPWSILR